MASESDLRTEVAEELGDIDATIDMTAIRRELNRGVRDILRKTGCFVKTQEVTPGAVDDYRLGSDVLEVVELYFTVSSSDGPPLERVSLAEILEMRRAAAAVAASGARFYAFTGGLLSFYPAPGASDALTMYYTPAPTAMSDGTHDPSSETYGPIPADYHELIARYAMARLASRGDDSTSAQGSRYRSEYQAGIAEMRRELHRRGGRRLAPAVLGGRRRQRIRPADPAIPLR